VAELRSVGGSLAILMSSDDHTEGKKDDSEPVLVLALAAFLVAAVFYLMNNGYRIELANTLTEPSQFVQETVHPDLELISALQRVLDAVHAVSAIQMEKERELESRLILDVPADMIHNSHPRFTLTLNTAVKGSLNEVERSCHEHLGHKIRHHQS